MRAIYALPETWGLGVGRALMAYGLASCAGRGCTRCCSGCWRGTSGRAGSTPSRVPADGAIHEFEIGGATLPEMRYRHDG